MEYNSTRWNKIVIIWYTRTRVCVCVETQCSKALYSVHYGLVIVLYMQTFEMLPWKGKFLSLIVNESIKGICKFADRRRHVE